MNLISVILWINGFVTVWLILTMGLKGLLLSFVFTMVIWVLFGGILSLFDINPRRKSTPYKPKGPYGFSRLEIGYFGMLAAFGLIGIAGHLLG